MARDKSREYTQSTIKKLHLLAMNQCAAPDCENQLIARDGETIISKICHIEGASAKGPRYNPDMNDDERRHFDNLILLCDECHSIIDNKDNEAQYPVLLLKGWKQSHERTALDDILKSNPSLLTTAINAIASCDFDETTYSGDESLQAFNIKEKIDYNAIKRNKALIEEYKIFYTKINALYKELEDQGSFKKEKLLRNIRQLYSKIKGEYVGDAENPMEIIRTNADNIIEDIEDKLLESIKSKDDFYEEDVSFGISIIMVDAFMRCKIFEEPETK